MNSEFLKEVLSSEEINLASASSKTRELLNTLKGDVKAVVDCDAFQINSLLKENDNLKSKAESLLNEMTLVEKQIDKNVKQEMANCSHELKNLSYSLKEINLFLKILKQLVDINSKLDKAREKINSQEYYECAQLVEVIQDLIKSNSDKLKHIEVFKVISQEVILIYELLLHQISETWSQCVNVYVDDTAAKNITRITISIDVNFKNKLSEILKASYCLKSNLVEKKFSNVLLDEVLQKVITNKSEISENTITKANLVISVFNDHKSYYLNIFENIKIIVDFLKVYLDVEIGQDETFLSKVGNIMAENLANSIIKNCLVETIPTTSEDLERYNEVVENAKVLEVTLKEAGFLPKDSTSFMGYVKNVNVLFANKFCQSYLNNARQIMKKDLHNIIKSEEINSNINVLPVKLKNVLKSKMNISEKTFLFPKCQISKQAEELLNLVFSIMNEIIKSSELCAFRLFYTVRNIFEMYCAIVPLHHKKFLETLPQQVAIFHNNCMYFSHNLINICIQYYDKIPYDLQSHFPILLEEAVVLRSLAAEMLEVTVTNQCNQLIFLLRDSGFATLDENPRLDCKCEKNLRQCIRAMQILRTVWIDILPNNIYARAFGFFLDSVTEELINMITAVEDIASQTASDLVSMFSILLEKAPDLFPNPAEMPFHAKKWKRFKEFVLILKGSLRDIGERWADGMGPLSLEFSAEEVKHLIRALFQNSERRAALLVKIR